MAGYFESAEPEGFEISSDLPGEQNLLLSEADEIELAAQLLEITSEEELDQFLGSVFRKVGKGLKKIAKPLGGILKKVAKVALPIAGKVAGTFFGGPVGGMIGGKLASVAGKAFGLETEGMSPEDRDLEIARRYVRLAAASARNARRMRGRSPSVIARRAVLRAARTHAPGIIRRRRRPGVVRPIRRPTYPRRPVVIPVAAYPAMDVVTDVPPDDATGPPPDMAPDADTPDANAMDSGPADTADDGAQDSADATEEEFLASPFRNYGRWVRRGRQVIIVNC